MNPFRFKMGLAEAYPPQAGVKRHFYLNALPEKSSLYFSSCLRRNEILFSLVLPRCQAPPDFRRVWQFLLVAGWNGAHPHGSGQWREQIGAFPIGAPLPSARDGKSWNGERMQIPGDPPDDRRCRREELEEKTSLLSSHFDTSHQRWRGQRGCQATSSKASSSPLNPSSSGWEWAAKGVASFTGAGCSSSASAARSSRQSRRS